MTVEKEFIVGIYCRVSTQDQTLEQQREPLERYCTDKGWSYAVYEEKTSGAKQSRRELDNLMTAVRGGGIKSVLVSKLDRLGRSLAHLIQLIEEFNNRGIRFICLNPEVDTTTSQGMFFIKIMGAVAELEREMIRDRTRAKLQYLKEKGVKLGRPKGSKDKRPRRKSGYHESWNNRKFQRKVVINKAPPQKSMDSTFKTYQKKEGE